MVGAAAMVRADVPPAAVVTGTPARPPARRPRRRTAGKLAQAGVTTALDLDALSRVRLGDPPHRWGYLERALAPAAAAEPRATFPSSRFWRFCRHDGEKDMSFRLRCLVPLGGDRAVEAESLSPAWMALVNELMSAAYRDAFADALGQSLDGHAVEVSAWRWVPARTSARTSTSRASWPARSSISTTAGIPLGRLPPDTRVRRPART